jgi:hypothetical protein
MATKIKLTINSMPYAYFIVRLVCVFRKPIQESN